MRQRFFLRGSVLIYTLFILIMLLVSGLALSTVVLLQQRGSATAGDSLNAFQSANDGFEDIMARYKRASGDTLSALGGCENGTITVSSGVVRPYTATFTKESDGSAVSDCNITKLSDISQVKIVSSVGTTTRAIETAFAANGTPLQQPCGSIHLVGGITPENRPTGCAQGHGNDSSWINDHCIYINGAIAGNTSGFSQSAVLWCYSSL